MLASAFRYTPRVIEPVDAIPMSAERLADVIAGLGGIAGFLFAPTLGAWLRLLLRLIESEGAGLGAPRRRFSTLALGRALALTAALVFVLFNWQRATGEPELRLGATPVGATLSGVAVGFGFWIVYALGLRALRGDLERRRLGRRFGSPLR